jgi:hypothetical protein
MLLPRKQPEANESLGCFQRMADTMHILQLGDTHWATSRIAPGIDSMARFEQVCRWIGSISDPIDWIVHTGDWVHRGHLATDSGESTRAAWNRLAEIGIPIVTAIGNHDHREALSQCFRKHWPDDRELHCIETQSDRLAYWFTNDTRSDRGESLLVLDTRGSTQIPREKSATTNSRPLKHCWPTRCVAGRFFFTIHLLLWIAIGSTERCLSEMECCYTRCLPRIPVASVGSFSVTFTAPCAVSRIAYCTQVPVVLRCTFPTCHGTIKHSHSAIQSPLQITYPLASLGHW